MLRQTIYSALALSLFVHSQSSFASEEQEKFNAALDTAYDCKVDAKAKGQLGACKTEEEALEQAAAAWRKKEPENYKKMSDKSTADLKKAEKATEGTTDVCIEKTLDSDLPDDQLDAKLDECEVDFLKTLKAIDEQSLKRYQIIKMANGELTLRKQPKTQPINAIFGLLNEKLQDTEISVEEMNEVIAKGWAGLEK
ncbi:hypothetical protein [Brackiella oedipodis]|uniref:hypothetical protein n=1 Tax=Brackiella oedipodis TaxID=124225 RepID=UPI00048BEB94|nr:hypothetical protein [Brackiella oedipodis]